MMGIRAFRSLHLISLFPSLRAVIRELLEGWKNLIPGISNYVWIYVHVCKSWSSSITTLKFYVLGF